MSSYYLGIDTSNYTTSIGIVDDSGKTLFDKRIVLRVKPGELGLRQSDAFYQHVMNLPGLFYDVDQEWLSSLKMISVSSRPRNVEGSYMPVFNAGVQFGQVIAKSLNIPLEYVSHQDGHIMADLDILEAQKEDTLLNLHISGGTTELFLSHWDEAVNGFVPKVIGGTKDISIGQLIDRIGVYFGCEFPCGSVMQDRIIRNTEHIDKAKIKLPLKASNGYFNLSGIENKIKGLAQSDVLAEKLMLTLFEQLGELLYTVLAEAITLHQPSQVILAGGVMSNLWIRKELSKLERQFPALSIHFTEAKLCTDNAVGVAKMGLLKQLR